jgi:hypothetical protein
VVSEWARSCPRCAQALDLATAVDASGEGPGEAGDETGAAEPGTSPGPERRWAPSEEYLDTMHLPAQRAAAAHLATVEALSRPTPAVHHPDLGRPGGGELPGEPAPPGARSRPERAEVPRRHRALAAGGVVALIAVLAAGHDLTSSPGPATTIPTLPNPFASPAPGPNTPALVAASGPTTTLAGYGSTIIFEPTGPSGGSSGAAASPGGSASGPGGSWVWLTPTEANHSGGSSWAEGLGGGQSQQMVQVSGPPTVPADYSIPADLARERIFYAGSQNVTVETAAGAAVATLPVAAYDQGQDSGPSPAVLGPDDEALWVSNGTAYAVSPDKSVLYTLGNGAFVFPLPGGLIGLESAGQDGLHPPAVVTPLSPEGTAAGTPMELPEGTWAVGATPAGLILETSHEIDAVWSPATGSTLRQFGPVQQVVGINGDQVAWVGGATCSPTTGSSACNLEVTNTATGATVSVQPPPGVASWLGGGGFSPDGSMLATFGMSTSGVQELVDVRLDTATAVELTAVPTLGATQPTAQWTSDGNWLIYGGTGNLSAIHLTGLTDPQAPAGPAGSNQNGAGPYRLPVSVANNPLPL